MKIKLISIVLLFVLGCTGGINQFTSVRDQSSQIKFDNVFMIPDLETVYGVEFTNAFKAKLTSDVQKRGYKFKSLSLNLHSDSKKLTLNQENSDSLKISFIKSEITSVSPKYLMFVGIDKSWSYSSGDIAKSSIIISMRSNESNTEVYKATFEFQTGSTLLSPTQAGEGFAILLFNTLVRDKVF